MGICLWSAVIMVFECICLGPGPVHHFTSDDKTGYNLDLLPTMEKPNTNVSNATGFPKWLCATNLAVHNNLKWDPFKHRF
ncbi:unnamed protein product [Protopolystoma xenopodis]|uniref:Uncharacterized protein n=1 Tax=Protopolystoma xenopodis TaxID=117903 RepID=A0A448XRZ3_9PLAT|nr:unnamed protein product [Protopolystoma xenopodis]